MNGVRSRRWAISAALLLTVLYGCEGDGNDRSDGTVDRVDTEASVDGATTPDRALAVRSGTPHPAESPDEPFFLGAPRDDLERFFGLYGDPADPENPSGQVFVTRARRPVWAEQAPQIPPGYLAIGAMWGDVPPMYMRSLDEATFEQVDLSDFAPPELNVVRFDIRPDGTVAALSFTAGAFSELGRRIRVGELPEEWR